MEQNLNNTFQAIAVLARYFSPLNSNVILTHCLTYRSSLIYLKLHSAFLHEGDLCRCTHARLAPQTLHLLPGIASLSLYWSEAECFEIGNFSATHFSTRCNYALHLGSMAVLFPAAFWYWWPAWIVFFFHCCANRKPRGDGKVRHWVLGGGGNGCPCTIAPCSALWKWQRRPPDSIFLYFSAWTGPDCPMLEASHPSPVGWSSPVSGTAEFFWNPLICLLCEFQLEQCYQKQNRGNEFLINLQRTSYRCLKEFFITSL